MNRETQIGVCRRPSGLAAGLARRAVKASPEQPRSQSHSTRRSVPHILNKRYYPPIQEQKTMAEYGEWNRKGATLSDATAQKEYGISRELIIQGIREGKLEYREGAIWGNPYLKLLRGQLEAYIAAQLGPNHLNAGKHRTELKKINKEIASLESKLAELRVRKTMLETGEKDAGNRPG